MIIVAGPCRLRSLLRHVDDVRRNCRIVGQFLVVSGRAELGRELIARGLRHDASKFDPEEFDHLGGPGHARAIARHHRKNDHHPEHWHPSSGIHLMSEPAILEMTCDWVARSQEFGTSVGDWVRGPAMARFHFHDGHRVYRTIHQALDLLLEPAFT